MKKLLLFLAFFSFSVFSFAEDTVIVFGIQERGESFIAILPPKTTDGSPAVFPALPGRPGHECPEGARLGMDNRLEKKVCFFPQYILKVI